MFDLKILKFLKQDVFSLKIFILFFFLVNFLILLSVADRPIGDFGNYYYGCRLFLNGINPILFYNDIHFFNESIRTFESGVFFENYAPVPPFSLLFYMPFLVFNCVTAKFVFSLVALISLCFSLYRAIKLLNVFSYWLFLLPLIFFQPLYSNFVQGQTYLFITALLLEFCIALKNKRSMHLGLIVAVLFSLKIYPALIVLLLFKNNNKAIGWTVIMILAIQLLTYFVIGHATFLNYYVEILPRLLNNEITEPFGYFNQSLHTMLLNLFVAQPYLNPTPFLNLPIAALLIQALFYAVLVNLVLQVQRFQPAHFSLAFLLLVLCLLNQYNTVYGLLVLLPVAFAIKDLPKNKFILLVLLLFLICSLPVFKLQHLPLLLQYTRFWMLLVVLAIFLSEWRIKIKPIVVLPLFLAFAALSLDLLDVDQEPRENLSGADILYDVKIKNDSLFLYSCMGNKDKMTGTDIKIQTYDSLTLLDSGKGVMIDYKIVYRTKGRIKKCFLVNGSQLLVLTDEERGYGLFRLISKNLDLI
jgi:hypothetical protein